MAWIDLPDDEATPKLARLTSAWRKQGRKVPSVIAVMKHAPDTLRSVLKMNDAVTFGGSVLGRRREELVATTVSALNACFY
jgi:alkylhydroperoxidase family enzyme